MDAKSARERVLRAIGSVEAALDGEGNSSLDRAFMALGKAFMGYIVFSGGDPEKVLAQEEVESNENHRA